MDGFEELRAIGIQKIHEQTHITKRHIEAIFNREFEIMSRVQFFGFISILEREYKLDLSSLKREATAFYDEKALEDESSIFVVSKSADRKKTSIQPVMYIAGALSIFLLIIYLSINGYESSQTSTVEAVDNTTIKTAQKNIMRYKENVFKEEKKVELNTSLTKNNDLNISKETKEDMQQNQVNQDSVEPSVFKVLPRRKVWFGYIDLTTHKRYQKTFKGELDLDPKKEWLIVAGHSNIKFDVNGEMFKYKTKYNLRLHYKDAKLTKISVDEFRRLNGGKKW